ncbi:MAG: LuxR C-terminal-related transcriptional regulator [Thermomicrobiales bacterium]
MVTEADARPFPFPGSPPVARTALIGRSTERATARRLLLDDAAPVLTLSGPGGSGKTRLAQSLATDLTLGEGRRVVWVDLAPLVDGALTTHSVSQALGLAPAPGLEPGVQVAAALQTQPTILILDNCEHVLEAVASLVASWLPACPDLQILATSRSPLRLRSERDLPVEPFSLPAADDPPATLLHNDAVRLFAERAVAVSPRFSLDEGNVQEIAAICRALDGLPLAIELAAAHMRFLSLGVLHTQMADRLNLLRGGARDLPTRQRTIADTIAWSYALLTAPQRALFRRLGVFAGGWTLPAALAVAAGAEDEEPVTMHDITALLDQSLIRRDYDSAGLRFTMLETIREFALRELTASGDAAATRDRHAAWHRDLVASLDLHLAMQGDTARTRQLIPEQDNLRLALAQFHEVGDAVALNRLSAALAKLWFDLGQYGEARHWLAQAIAHSEGVDLLDRARSWNKAAWLAMCQGDLVQAAALRETGLKLARDAADPFLLAEAVFEAGILAFWQGELGAATALFDEAQTALAAVEATHASAPIKRCSMVNLLGGIALISGDLPLALERGEMAVEMARALGASSDLGYSLCGLGYALLQADRIPEATACLLEALADTWLRQDLPFLARLHWAFAAVALHREQPETAAQLVGAADALDARTGSAMWPNDRVLATWCTEALDAALPSEELAQCRRNGADLPLERAVQRAFQLASNVLGDEPAAAIWAQGNGPALPLLLDESSAVQEDAGSALDGNGASRLTGRERVVLAHLVDGCTDREIAALLFISRRTVSKHLESVFAKLGVHSRGAAVAEAQRLGFTGAGARQRSPELLTGEGERITVLPVGDAL